MTTLNEYAKNIHKTAVEHGWWEPQCEHELARLFPNGSAWCEPCGAFSQDAGKSWFIPNVSANRNFGEVIALIHSENSEALEEWRDGRPAVYAVNGKPEGWAIEIIDGMIRSLDYLCKEGIDIDAVMEMKMLYNESRPYRHGGKLA